MSLTPPRKVKGRKEPTPEELQRIKFRANCRFRVIVRQAMANAHWLLEDEEDYSGIDNVQRRVKQAIRSKSKKTNLTINDKALLSKPAEDRTENEKKYLYRILGGLKCFKRYPDEVKMKLASLLYFRYFCPGRVIVRQRQEAHALYFIVSGEIIVSIELYDELLKKKQSIDVGVMQPGDLFGEVSLLHNIPRTATCTTGGHCELLEMKKEDFKNVLQASLQKQWDTVKLAMSNFRYFDSLDEVAVREGCIVSKMKKYGANETILGDGVGVPNFVYFLLSGQCQMIESLKIKVTERCGREYYSLYEDYTPEEETSLDLEAKYFSSYKTKTEELKPGSESIPEPEPDQEPDSPKNEVSIETSGRANSRISRTLSFKLDQDSTLECESLKRKDSSKPYGQTKYNPSMPSDFASKLALNSKEEEELLLLNNVKTYFMQVCQFIPGATFGFSQDNLRDRRIVSLTPVTCMLMPKVWLLQKNTADIWTRIKHYLEKKIPSKRQMFKEFVIGRRWKEYREKVVDEVMSKSKRVNYTLENDVPYSIRMDEIVDL